MKKGVVANNKGVLTNKGYKDIVEAVGFILMVVSIITLLCVTYEVKELRDLTKNATDFRTIRK